jgi:choline-phosphate cytidylyltransferase
MQDKQIRIYCDGVFDLFHFGHARSFEQAKKSFPNVYILVGVMSDIDTMKNKGLFVMNENERAESVSHCKWVDEVIKCPPWVLDQEFLDKYQIDYVAHDVLSYPTGSPNDVHKFVKDKNQFMETQRTQDISTSGLISRIVENSDLYLLRNIKRGVPVKISWFKRLLLKFFNKNIS